MKYITRENLGIFLVSFMLGMVTCFISSYKQVDVIAAEIIVNHPEIFPLNKELRKYCEKWLNIYYTMTEDNMNETEILGATLKESKKVAINKVLSIMTDSMTSYYKNSSINTFGIYRIGSLNHTLQGNYRDVPGWTEEQHTMYLSNMKKVLLAVPRDLPNKEVLSRFAIDSITYNNGEAKVLFVEDNFSKALAMKNRY